MACTPTGKTQTLTIKALQPTSKQRRRLRTPNPLVRQQFIAAAADLMNREKFQTLRVEEIAQHAGLSIGTFYLYFESKDDLFVGLVIEYTGLLRRRLEAAIEPEGTVPERLRRALDAYLDFVRGNERGFLYYKDLGNVETTVGPLSAWAYDQTAAALRPLLEEGLARGEIRGSNAELLAQSLVGLTQHLAGYWLQNKDRFSREQVKEVIRSLVAHGIEEEEKPRA